MDISALKERPSLTFVRRYAAPPERVWRAWTEPAALKQWFGPANEPVAVAEIDLRVGGRFRIEFGGKDGREHEVQGVYREVIPPEKLVFTWTWPRSTPERESLVTIIIARQGEGTELVFKHEGFYDQAVRDGHEQGWTGAFAKLERYLEGGGHG
jgi:uncharacterized protein YndB with AHSA1/START domain